MFHRIMSNNNLKILNESAQQLNSRSQIPIKKLKKSHLLHNSINKNSEISINIKTSEHTRSSEILADQNSNSNSDESSEVSSSDSAGDQRTMDAADTLLSIANTPTTEFKSFLASSSTTSSPNDENKIEISVNSDNNLIENMISLEELTKPAASNTEDEKKKFQSAVQLILEQASKRLGSGKIPTSITIKTTTTPVSSKSDDTDNQFKNSISPHISDSINEKLNAQEKFETHHEKESSSIPIISTTNENYSLSTNTLSNKMNANSSQSIISPVTSSSSFMFLSTGQAKKQKKFRLDSSEFKPDNIVILQNDKPKVNLKLGELGVESIKSEPNMDCKISEQKNKIVEMFNQGSVSAKIDTNEPVNKTLENFYSDSNESELSSYSNGQPKTKKDRLDSGTSSVTNLNDSSMSIYTIRSAPTLATGRRSKDVSLPPEESKKRQERRDRNKEAAARCRRKREDLTLSLTKQTELLTREQEGLKRKHQELSNEKNKLEKLLQTHEKSCGRVGKNTNDTTNLNQNAQSQQQHQQLIRIKKEDIDDIKKISSEKIQQKLTVNTSNQNFQPSTQNSSNSSNSSNTYNSSSLIEKNIVKSPDGTRGHSNQTLKYQNTNQLNQELFQQMLNNIDQQSSKLLTPQSGNSISSDSFSFNSSSSSSSKNHQLKRPGNLELNKQSLSSSPSPSLSSFNNKNDYTKKIKEQNNNASALYHILNSASNNSFINGNTNNTVNNRQISHNRNNGILLTPTLQLNTPILNYGSFSFALTPLFDHHPLTPSVLQQHLVSTPIEKVNEQNANGES